MSRMLLRQCAGVMAVFLLLAATSVIAADVSPRLKYRAKGPVCSCTSGLSEEEISRGMVHSGLDRLQGTGQDATALSEKNSTQPTRRNANEDRK